MVDTATSTWRLATRPFNGQRSRQDLFHNLIEKFAPIAIVETGTYLATTTEFMAKTGLPIFSVESDARNYGLARARLWWHRNVHLLRGDSRAALRTLFHGPLRGARDHKLLIYLDAHWKEDLPLAEELEIIFSGFPNAVVMVDDFHVPFDSGYGYDDYGTGRSLTADYIEPIVGARPAGLLSFNTIRSRNWRATRLRYSREKTPHRNSACLSATATRGAATFGLRKITFRFSH
jgi:hypothetical protein